MHFAIEWAIVVFAEAFAAEHTAAAFPQQQRCTALVGVAAAVHQPAAAPASRWSRSVALQQRYEIVRVVVAVYGDT